MGGGEVCCKASEFVELLSFCRIVGVPWASFWENFGACVEDGINLGIALNLWGKEEVFFVGFGNILVCNLE